jgi:hypothetical protein
MRLESVVAGLAGLEGLWQGLPRALQFRAALAYPRAEFEQCGDSFS